MLKHIVLIAVATLAPLISIDAAGQVRPEREVLQTQQRRLAAAQKQDVETLGNVLAEELQYCHTTGAIDSKATYLEVVRSGSIRWLEVKPVGMRARVYGDAAVVTGRLEQKISTGGDPIDMTIRTIDVYVKREGRWQLTDFQASLVPPKPGAKPR